MKNRVAIYPGSFDPFTLGHKIIVDKSLDLFDKLVVAIGYNSNKSSFFTLEKRIELITKVYGDNPNVEIITYEGLTADLCRDLGMKFIVRGIRNVGDFESERNISQINKSLNSDLETIFLMTPSQYSEISSSIVREILINKGNPMQFMPSEVSFEDISL